jgi:two-component system, HptB-dependent secretion and biofilm response regulator
MSLSVFVVEDDERLNAVFCKYLNANSFAVEGFTSVAAALEALETHTAPQAIIVDLDLGDGSGTTVLQTLRDAPKFAHTRAVVASGNAYDRWQELQAYKVAHTLIKPVSPRALLVLLQALFNEHV